MTVTVLRVNSSSSAQGRKVALEVGYLREPLLHSCERGRLVGCLGRLCSLHDLIEDLQGPALRRPQAEPVGDRGDLTIQANPMLVLGLTDIMAKAIPQDWQEVCKSPDRVGEKPVEGLTRRNR